MNIKETLHVAVKSLGANKMRSGLTMLGIVIGVMAVVSMLSIGQGAQASITSQIDSMGTNLLFIRPGNTQQGGVQQQNAAVTLTVEDGTALLNVQNVVAVGPEVDSFGQVVYQGNNSNVRILGVTPDYPAVVNANVADGDFVSQSNVTASAADAVLGAQIAQQLFGGSEPVGQSIRINGQAFRVVGVMEARGGTGFNNVDTQIYVPITTASTRLSRNGQFRGGNSVSVLNVEITDPKAQDQVVQDISDVLRQRHHIQFQDDFTIQSQQDILNTASQVSGTLTIFLGGIAAISLIVGGIGIMNIMLVSVTERTREIGLRKAIGAHKRDILVQFLSEAMILSLCGGVLGIMFGALVAAAVSGVQVGSTTLHTVIAPSSVVLSVAFSGCVGLFFGGYPANRAASLRPIEALRYE
jgi:putative ABC transport system permease protein